MSDPDYTEEKTFCPVCLIVGLGIVIAYCFGFCPENFADSLPFLVFAGGCVIIGVIGMVVDWRADRSSEVAEVDTSDSPLNAPEVEGHFQ